MARSQTASMPIEVLQTTRPSTFLALMLRRVFAAIKMSRKAGLNANF